MDFGGLRYKILEGQVIKAEIPSEISTGLEILNKEKNSTNMLKGWVLNAF